MFKVQTAISSNTFTAFLNRVILTEQPDNTSQLLGKDTSYEFICKQSSELLPIYPYKSLRSCLLDYMVQLPPFLTPDMFTEVSLNCLVTHCIFSPNVEFIFSVALFLQFAFNTLFSLYRSFTVRKIPKTTTLPSFCYWL